MNLSLNDCCHEQSVGFGLGLGLRWDKIIAKIKIILNPLIEKVRATRKPLKFEVTSFKVEYFVCLFVWGLLSNSKTFHSYGEVTITGEGLQILTIARHLWPKSSDGSLTYHTNYHTGLPFTMVIFEDP